MKAGCNDMLMKRQNRFMDNLAWTILGFTVGYFLAALVAARTWGRLP